MKFSTIVLLLTLLSVPGLALSLKTGPDPRTRLTDLKKQLAAKPSDSKLNLEIGRLHLELNEVDDAIRYLRAASADPSRESMMLMAQAYGKKGDTSNELRTLNSLIERNGRDPEAYELMGRAYARQKNVNKAAPAFRKAIELAPKNRSAYEGLLDLFKTARNNYETRVVLEDLVKRFGPTAEWQFEYCRTYASDNYFEEGIKACKKAIEMKSDIPESHVYLGKMYLLTQKKELASRILVKAAKQFPKSELAQQAAGELHDEQKSWETSIHYYKRCVEGNPLAQVCWKKLGLALFELKDYQPSLEAFEKACQLKAGDIKDFQRVASLVRIQKVSDFAQKFQTGVERCQVMK